MCRKSKKFIAGGGARGWEQRWFIRNIKKDGTEPVQKRRPTVSNAAVLPCRGGDLPEVKGDEGWTTLLDELVASTSLNPVLVLPVDGLSIAGASWMGYEQIAATKYYEDLEGSGRNLLVNLIETSHQSRILYGSGVLHLNKRRVAENYRLKRPRGNVLAGRGETGGGRAWGLGGKQGT